MATVEQAGVELVVEGLRQFMAQMKEADKSVDGLGAAAGKSSSILDGAFATALGVGIVKAAKAAIDAVMKLAGAVVGFTAESFTMATEFQTSLVGLEIAASATGLSFDTLHSAAIQVGGDTSLLGVSASGAAEAMTGLFKAGLSNVEVFGDLEGYLAGTAELGGALRASIDLAAATELDMVQASELAAVALSTFGAGLKTAEERSEFVNTAMNNMVQSADASVASVSELAAAMVNVGPTAAALGMPIEDMNNALALLSMRGIRGAEAGTALKSMLTNLQRPTPAVTQALEDLNVSLYDASGNFVGMENLVGQLETAYADLTPEQRNLNSQIIAGSYGMNALNTLVGEGVGGWNDMADATANAATIQEQAAAYADTYAGKLEAMEGNMETLKIQIGEALMPVMTTLLGTFSELIDQYGPQIVTAFEGIIAGIGPVIEWFANLVLGGGDLSASFALLPESIQPFATFITETLIPTLTEIWNWLSINLPPALQTLSDFWTGTLLPAINAVWAFIQGSVIPILTEVWNWLSANLPPAIQALSDFWTGTLLPAIQTTFAWIQANVVPILLEVVAMIQQFPATLAIWAQNWQMFKEIIAAVWDNIKARVQEGIDAIVNFWSVGNSSIWQDIATIWGAIITVIVGFLALIVAAVGAWWGVFGGYWTEVWGGVQAILAQTWTNILAYVTNVLEGLKAIISTSWEAIKTIIDNGLQIWRLLVNTVASLIRGDFQQAWDNIKEIFSLAWENLKTVVSSSLENIKTAISTGWESIKIIFTGALENIKLAFTAIDWGAVGQSIIEGIANGISAAAGMIADAAKNAAQAALDAAKKLLGIKSPSSVFRDEVGKNIDYGIAAGVADFTPVITKQMGNLTSALLPALGGMTQMLSGLAPASAAGRTTNYNSNANSNSVTNNMIHLTPALALETVGMTIAA